LAEWQYFAGRKCPTASSICMKNASDILKALLTAAEDSTISGFVVGAGTMGHRNNNNQIWRGCDSESTQRVGPALRSCPGLM
jgi:hypothetical protein